MALKIAFPDYPMELAVGFGGTNYEDVDSRIFGHVVPALDFARSFKRINKLPPLVRIFFANELTSGVNPIESNKAECIAQATAINLKQFTSEFYPDILDSIIVSFPKINQISDSLKRLGIDGNARIMLENICQDSEETKHFVNQLVSIGESKGSNEDGTAHYIFGHITPEIFGNYVDPSKGPISVIKFGGLSEEKFTHLQRVISDKINIDGSGLARTHAYKNPNSGDITPHQLSLININNDTPPYYCDARANAFKIIDKQISYDYNRSPDKNTKLAIDRAGGITEFANFMNDLIKKT
ncbi:MAG: hypothetical protein PHW82_12855 [Bacteroidales bacterium]|nr:hypothetical protein [Bacteroidales bacterium]